MRLALPTGLLSSTFTIHDDEAGPALATVKLPSALKAGSIQIADVPYSVEQPDWLGRTTTLAFEGIEVGRAERPSVWKRDLVVSFASGFSGDLGPFRLKPMGLFKTGYRVMRDGDGDTALGDIDQPRMLHRDLRIDLPSTVPFLAQAFLTVLVLTEIRRQRSSSS